jgi:hypothetical protein
MLTLPQIVEKARARSNYTDINFPTNRQWLDFITQGIKSVWQLVFQHQPRALPVSTVQLTTINDQLRYDLPYDFAGSVDVEWNEAVWGSPIPILPVHRRHPLIFPSRKTFLNTTHWKYEIHKKEGAIPERYQLAIYPRPQNSISGSVGSNTVVVSYVPRPLELHYGVAQAAGSASLTFSSASNLTGILVGVPDYYKNCGIWVYDALAGKYQGNVVASYNPLSQIATMATPWATIPTASGTITIQYMTVPTVPQQWIDAIIAEAITYAILKDSDFEGKLQPMQSILALEWRKLKTALDLSYPCGPQLVHDVEDLT